MPGETKRYNQFMTLPQFAACPVCKKERRLVKRGGAIVLCDHRRWDEKEKKMVPCEGRLKPPPKPPPGVVFRRP